MRAAVSRAGSSSGAVTSSRSQNHEPHSLGARIRVGMELPYGLAALECGEATALEASLCRRALLSAYPAFQYRQECSFSLSHESMSRRSVPSFNFPWDNFYFSSPFLDPTLEFSSVNLLNSLTPDEFNRPEY